MKVVFYTSSPLSDSAIEDVEKKVRTKLKLKPSDGLLVIAGAEKKLVEFIHE